MAISLSDRIRQVLSGQVPTAPPSTAPHVPSRRDVAASEITAVLGGEWVESSEGAIAVVDRQIAPQHRHGLTTVGDIVEGLHRGNESLATLERAWPGRVARPYTSDLCFFDLETTGLAGGAGTQAFLVGAAWVEGDGLRIRQWLLPGFEHERALLEALRQWATPEPRTLVTFNGRSFDLPLIETRYLYHRASFPLAEWPHLDMLHPARRFWKQRPTVAGPALDDESCRLSTLERHLAGHHRIGDVPGFDIPARFFRFVREGDVHGLQAVLEHNRLDLISLALVTAKALTLLSSGPASTRHAREALGLGCVYERSGLIDNAEAAFAHAADMAARVGREPEVRAEALRRLALCRRRSGRVKEAAAAWEQLLQTGRCPAVWRREALEALAIHHEHRSRDLDTARNLVMDVLAAPTGARTRAAAEYRLQRLDRKIASRPVYAKGGLLAALEPLNL